MAIDLTRELFEVQKLSPEVARTWDPDLHRERRLLVPIQVDALAVRSEGGTWADCRMRSPEGLGTDEKPPRSIDLLPEPFADLDEARARGVYLHWAMPDALLRLDATGEDAENPQPPALPDRWLVVRVWTPRGAVRRSRTAWILDARTPDGAVPLSAWTPATPAGEPITGFGTGDPAWSAYYDNTADRFAFYDDMAGVTGSVSYLVCGWYAVADEDPIGGADISTWAGFHARMDELGWNADQIQPDDDAEPDTESVAARVGALYQGLEVRDAVLAADGRVTTADGRALVRKSLLPVRDAYRAKEGGWPERVLLHGAVAGIGWPSPLGNGESGELGGPPPASSIRVAFAPSGPEALGAVVAAARSDAGSEDAVAALAMGVLPELDDESALARLDVSLHQAAFASRKADDNGAETIWQGPARGPYQVPDPPHRTKAGSRVLKGKKRARPGAEKLRRMKDQDSPFVRRGMSIKDLMGKHGSRSDPDALDQGEWVTVARAAPRWFQPADPVILVQGAKRSLKYGGDGRFSEDGRLPCRLSDQPVRAVSVRRAESDAPLRIKVLAEEILDRGLNHGGVPPACDVLLRELVVLDPGSAPVIADRVIDRDSMEVSTAVTDGMRTRQTEDVLTEQTAWWATYDPRVSRAGIEEFSGLEGTLPCPLAFRPSNRPWAPMHLDWEVDYLPSTEGVRDWTLDEIDHELTGTVPEEEAEALRLSGRCLLTSGIADAAARTVRAAQEAAARSGGTGDIPPDTFIAWHSVIARMLVGEINALTGEQDELSSLADTLEDMDVLSGALEHFHLRLRRDVPDDAPLEGAIPEDFVALRAGTLRLRRVRLVDGFGQVLWLAGSGVDTRVDPGRLLLSESAALPAAPGHFAAPPRFTAPARLWFRWVRPEDPEAEATPDNGPVCGWLLPDHLDGALEFFDAAGAALGQLRLHPDLGAAWELAPGRPSTVGGTPAAAIGQPQLAGIAQALADLGLDDATEAPGRETALAALLRVIDSTLWTVDPFGRVGEEHLSLLIGHPVAVLRAVIRLEVEEPASDVGNEQVAVPIRLGALTHWEDGLFGYFVGNDFRTFRCVRKEAAEHALDAPPDGFLGPAGTVHSYYERFLDDLTAGGSEGSPVTHPYIDSEGLLWTVPGQTHVLTLLVEPHCVVHATSGVVPRKEIGLRRSWVDGALGAIAPTFRYGPVLRDPREVRMPIAADVGGAWTWTHRTDVDVWAEEPVSHDAGDAMLPPDPAVAQEGWLRLTPDQEGGSDG